MHDLRGQRPTPNLIWSLVERSGPLERRTPLKGGKPLARSTPMRPPLPRQRATLRPVAPSRRTSTRRTGPAGDTRDLVTVRDRGLCVRCGSTAGNVHHREGRGMGGRGRNEGTRTNGPAYLLSLCGSGTTGCHGWVESNREAAYEQGYLLRRNITRPDAAAVPVLTADGWQRFTDDGGRCGCPPPAEDPDE